MHPCQQSREVVALGHLVSVVLSDLYCYKVNKFKVSKQTFSLVRVVNDEVSELIEFNYSSTVGIKFLHHTNDVFAVN